MHRAENLVKEDRDKLLEIIHVKEALTANKYESWMFNIPKKTEGLVEKDNTSKNLEGKKSPHCNSVYKRDIRVAG